MAVTRILNAHEHRRHVGVAKAIVNNNPETMELRRRPFLAAAGGAEQCCDAQWAFAGMSNMDFQSDAAQL
ncbi:MAG TPA: hypothetical protein VFV12_08890 [Xanthobacteraceae bacterium]|nr:hypothetical protein [Xanthobacteraceae bacterium]